MSSKFDTKEENEHLAALEQEKARLENACAHLERSNVELGQAIQADGEDAEYRLRAELIDPPAVDDSYKCDKWEAPCPQQWMADSAAAAGRRPAVGTALAAAAAALALLRRGRPLRRHT